MKCLYQEEVCFYALRMIDNTYILMTDFFYAIKIFFLRGNLKSDSFLSVSKEAQKRRVEPLWKMRFLDKNIDLSISWQIFRQRLNPNTWTFMDFTIRVWLVVYIRKYFNALFKLVPSSIFKKVTLFANMIVVSWHVIMQPFGDCWIMGRITSK